MFGHDNLRVPLLIQQVNKKNNAVTISSAKSIRTLPGRGRH
jgi:hypothetical protein